MRVVDNRGLPCPQPVINTRKALKETEGPVVSIVDNEAARENVTRFARSQGYEVEAVQEGGIWRLTIARPAAKQPASDTISAPAAPAGQGAGAERPTVARSAGEVGVSGAETGQAGGAQVILVGTDRLGRGSDELGSVLMRSFLYTLTQLPSPPGTLIFINAGVRLTTEGSPVLEELCQLHDMGTEILSCGTCLDYFGLREKLAVGRVTNMYEIAETLTSPCRVLAL
ncbi:MAG: sulfurtransferase-like selenium metabolism protein YedF [Bacillota bacterium]|nr:sulfurtransferase-like selenium metabolism protein YedF [Bacillota bacterium]MDI7250347.1 sulfurtransferase-like selenium metabolism protein YedF [Bacillota bacterium]